jgi:hypothetical protein
MIYRRFGFLHTRVLFWKQDELKEIEKKLDILDAEDQQGDPRARKCLRSRKYDVARGNVEGKESRAQLIKGAETLLREYGE